MSLQPVATPPPAFNPYNQKFEWRLPDGSPVDVYMEDLDFARTYGVKLGIVYASQIGASVILLLVLLLLTKREKMRSSIFVMNALCLVINIIRSVLQCLWLTGAYFHPYAFLTQDFGTITGWDMSESIATNTMNLLLVICIMISLSLQVWVVCITTPRLQRVAILGATTAVALVAVGYRFAITVISNRKIVGSQDMTKFVGLTAGMYITQAVAIWIYCSVFTCKLGFALIQRRKLGMSQFGPMQIIFIMGCQTMLIPAIFSILQIMQSVPELASQSLTVVCIFLPMSAIWAGVIASDVKVSGRPTVFLQDQFGRSGNTKIDKYSTMASTTNSSNTLRDPYAESVTSRPTRSYELTGAANDRVVAHAGHEWKIEPRSAPSTAC
ncbi:fungal pheromone mating factor STE2 GPCR-domain-containing protein [Massariosphaeria phaeospora]|uniref:Fungal pheromone mating factor STE2 GPCR-domain-containing protein n=1 Tax=Massariosphaeria phaeospora TaxID=100035 RepID=A0A7C8M1E6_9PLEO|nr:fungal pheromone mating factor STE2 GPCR-domain-containing protein [Massariosphaeria phaeospora]